MNLALIALAVGGFALGTTEFVVMGLLPDISRNIGTSIPETAYSIAAYALGVVIGSPILMAITARMPPKKMLMIFMGLFTLFNGLSALAFNFDSLVLFRFLSGAPHGAFFGAGSVVAGLLAKPGKAASAIALMFAGLTIANILGAPFATYIGHNLGWRWAFGFVALIGLATCYAIRSWMPVLEVHPTEGLLEDLKILKRPEVLLLIAVISIGFGGFFAWMSYLAPLLTRQTGFSENSIPFLLAVAGFGMTFGNWLGGRLADRVPPLKAIIGLMLAVALILGLSGMLASFQAAMIILTFVTGATALALSPSIQVLLISYSEGAEMFGASIGQSSFNTGNALGAYLGGIPIAMGFAYSSSLWVGAALSVVGALLAWGLLRLTQRNQSMRQG